MTSDVILTVTHDYWRFPDVRHAPNDDVVYHAAVSNYAIDPRYAPTDVFGAGSSVN